MNGGRGEEWVELMMTIISSLYNQMDGNIIRLNKATRSTVASRALKHGHVWQATGNLSMELRREVWTGDNGISGYMVAEVMRMKKIRNN